MRLRLLSYNIHKGIGGVDRRYDLDRITHTVAHHAPDVALLQEVAQDSKVLNHDVQVDVLAESLGLPHRTYFVNVRRWRLGEYGNAILSRDPIVRTENVDLTLPGRKRRSVLHAEVAVERDGVTRSLHLFNLHLGLSSSERKRQLATFLDCEPFRDLDARTPIVVAGDFNDVWGNLGRLLEPAGFRGLGRPIRTFPAWGPVRALDSIYVRGDLALERVEASGLRTARRASDHLPLIADLRLAAPTGAPNP